MLKINIRNFRRQDIEEIKTLANLAFMSENDKYWSVVGAMRAPHTLIAEIKGKIVGAIEFESYRLSRSIEGHIWYIFVHPDFQRKGIGTSLLREAEYIMCREGSKRFWALTSEDNKKTQRFFEKNGYGRVTIGEMKRILGGGNAKRLLRRMVYWSGDIIYMKPANKKENL